MNGISPAGIFINTNNTIYVVDQANNQILMWLEGDINPTKTISGNLNTPYGLFVTMSDDIYVDNGILNHRLDKWTSNATNSTPVMYVDSACYNVFIDMNDNLYCSEYFLHQVLMKSLNSGINESTVAAGTGCPGMASHMLYKPFGIFVDIYLNLYVADAGNSRIQMFPVGELNGITKVGYGAPGTNSLVWPSGIIVDDDGYLFILDHPRVVRSGPSGFQCLVGCLGTGLASYKMSQPSYFSFDSYGNIFVVDSGNTRVQKFFLATNSCGKYDKIYSKVVRKV